MIRVQQYLNETVIGRAIAAYFADLPLWTVTNMVFALALVPSFLSVWLGEWLWAIWASFPAAFVLNSTARAASEAAHKRVPSWRHLLNLQYRQILPWWGILAIFVSVLLLPLPGVVLGLMCAVAVGLLVISPFSFGVMAVQQHFSAGIIWRNAFVLAVHYPLVGLGMAALAFLLSLSVAATRGGLILAVPSLWVIITIFTTQHLIVSIQHESNEASGYGT